MVGVDAHTEPHSGQTNARNYWRLRYRVGDLEHYTEWTTAFPTVENRYEQYRRRPRISEVCIERLETVGGEPA